MDHLIATDALADALDRRERPLAILDASFYLPTELQNPRALFEVAHIPGAQFFDIETIADRSTDLPHMLPDDAEFAAAIAALGISNDTDIIVYDQRGLFSAARVWWMFRAHGHTRVAVLDGGLPKWRAESRPIASGTADQPVPAQFVARLNPDLVRHRHHILEVAHRRNAKLLDARAAARFDGTAPEPRPGMRAGHVPGAISLPFQELLNADQTLKSPATLRALFAERGVDGAEPVITMCGSGVTAAILTLGLHHAGLPIGGLYDGSWAEWGGRADTPIETANG
jgi:thiosulfate/3-mercaptopyruvate sulfurtransferase